MSESDEENTKAESLSDDQISAILTGYGEVGNELRYFGQRIHQSYALLISATVVLLGLRANGTFDWAFVLIVGGIVFISIGVMTVRFRIKQRSAEVVRRKVENVMSEQDNSEITHPLPVQTKVWEEVTRFGSDQQLRCSSNREEIRGSIPNSFKPSQFVSQLVLSELIVLLGVVSLIAGLGLDFSIISL